MAPERTKHSSKSGSTAPHGRRKPSEDDGSSALPGVQKIKRSLRQTRRLLDRGNLPADVKVETERRLKSLESDLAAAEQSRKERAMATRYHAAKFFERQKVIRKIKQAKKSMEADQQRTSERKKQEKALRELRIDLNYILHYPKADKYISLFPPEARKQGPDGQKQPLEPEPSQETDAKRQQLRRWIQERMESGELSSQPEMDLDEREDKKRNLLPVSNNDGKRGAAKHATRRKEPIPPLTGVADDFFGEDDEGGGEDEDEDMDSDGLDED